MATRKKTKAPAAPVPQSRDECAASIRKFGDMQREMDRCAADMNDAIAAATAQHQPELERLAQSIKATHAAVQAWCEAHRVELTDDGKRKSADLVTGTVQWRQRPPACKITGEDAVLSTLRLLKLTRYIRTKEEIDRDAILAARAAAANAPVTDPGRAELVAEWDRISSVAGIKVAVGIEDFVVTPAEVDVEVPA